MKSLQEVNTNLLGAVMKMIHVSKKGYYGYQYYSYDEDARSMKTRKNFLKKVNKRIKRGFYSFIRKRDTN